MPVKVSVIIGDPFGRGIPAKLTINVNLPKLEVRAFVHLIEDKFISEGMHDIWRLINDETIQLVVVEVIDPHMTSPLTTHDVLLLDQRFSEVIENVDVVSEVILHLHVYLRVRERGGVTCSGGTQKTFISDVSYNLGGSLSYQKLTGETNGDKSLLLTCEDSPIKGDLHIWQWILSGALIREKLSPKEPPVKIFVASERFMKVTILRAHRLVNYSDTALPVLIDSTTIPQLDTVGATTSAYNDIIPRNKAPVLNKLLAHGSEPLMCAIGLLDKELEADSELAVRFVRARELLLAKLEIICNVYKPFRTHTETAHRLVIHEFTELACFVAESQFSVETSTFTQKHSGTLGYGPCDVEIPKLVVRELRDEDPQASGKKRRFTGAEKGEPMSDSSDSSGDDSATDESEDSGDDKIEEYRKNHASFADAQRRLKTIRSEDGVLRVLENKHTLSDSALAQSGAMTVDLAVQTARVSGKDSCIACCLCTAHRYVYFTVRASVNSAVKPVITYIGEVSVAVLRMDLTLDEYNATEHLRIKSEEKSASKKTPLSPHVRRAARRPSHNPVNAKTIIEQDAVLCFKAMLAVMMGFVEGGGKSGEKGSFTSSECGTSDPSH